MEFLRSEIGNSVNVTYQLLNKLSVKVNKSTVRAKISSHPQSTSLIAIKDCLADFKVDSESYKIEKSLYKLSELQYPFIAFVSKNGGSFVIVDDFNSEMVKISYGIGETLILEKEFLSVWDGILLFAESTSESSEPDFYKNRLINFCRQLVLPFFCIAIICVLILVFKQNTFHWSLLILCVLKFTGLLASIFLVLHSFNVKTPVINKLCRLGGEGGCDRILKSAAANITSWLSWSEIGLFYFSGSLLVTLIFPSFTPTMRLINIVALPYPFYSLYYQMKYKKWCILCSIIQGILILEYFAFNWNVNLINTTSTNTLIFPVLLCFIIPIFIWALLKPLIANISVVHLLRQQLAFKYDINLFSLFLQNQKYYKISGDLLPIALGKIDSNTIITVITNPFCSACKAIHHTLNKLLECRKDIKIQIIFAVGKKDAHWDVASRLVALGQQQKTTIITKALNDWYIQMHYKQWAKTYPVVITEEVITACGRQKTWCEINAILYTPTVLVNGYELREPYNIEDLKYLVN